jgi:hypothetical protein
MEGTCAAAEREDTEGNSIRVGWRFAGTPFKGRLFASEWPVLVWASAADSDRLQQSLRIACIVYVSGDGLPVLYAYRSTPLRP